MEGTQPLPETLQGTEKGRRNTLASPYRREEPGMAFKSKQALNQHPGLEEMNLRTVALREIVIPPSTFGFSQSVSLCRGKDLFGGFVAAYQVGMEEGSVYLGVVTFPRFMMKYTGALMKEQSVKMERASHTQPLCPRHRIASDARSWELRAGPRGCAY